YPSASGPRRKARPATWPRPRDASVPEVLRPPRPAGAHVDADAEGLEVAVQDVRLVSGAVHPGFHHGCGVGLAAGDVLTAEVGYAGHLGAVPGGRAVGVGVVEEAALGHVVAERLRETRQGVVRGDGTASDLGALLIDQPQDLGTGGLLGGRGTRAGGLLGGRVGLAGRVLALGRLLVGSGGRGARLLLLLALLRFLFLLRSLGRSGGGGRGGLR